VNLVAKAKSLQPESRREFPEKIIAWDKLPEWRAAVRGRGEKLVVTNGCFDLLHLGHVTYLESARNLGDALLVGLNGDESVRQLKGDGRPINVEDDRAAVLAALESVDGVCVFAEKTATKFLGSRTSGHLRQRGDYTPDTVNQDERRLVEENGGRIVIVPLVPGRSTTALLEKLAASRKRCILPFERTRATPVATNHHLMRFLMLNWRDPEPSGWWRGAGDAGVSSALVQRGHEVHARRFPGAAEEIIASASCAEKAGRFHSQSHQSGIAGSRGLIW
jgi:rfaE bifunctional protein nucleotidyltransferase chain/domain